MIGATIVGIFIIVTSLFVRNAALEKSNSYLSFAIPTSVTQLPTATPSLLPTPTVDPDPIVNCSIHASCGGGSRQMKASECNQTTCCQIGDKWYFYFSKTKCLQDQAPKFSSSLITIAPLPTIPQYKYQAPTMYPPCTIFYPSLGTSETYYYTSPQDCQFYRNLANSNSFNPAPKIAPLEPTLSLEDVQAALYQIQQKINQCKNEINSYYNEQVNKCSQFEGSSGFEACTQAVNKERNKKLKECESQY